MGAAATGLIGVTDLVHCNWRSPHDASLCLNCFCIRLLNHLGLRFNLLNGLLKLAGFNCFDSLSFAKL
eukprot:UN14535